MGERSKVTVTMSNHSKSVPSTPGQSLPLLSGDAPHSQKVCVSNFTHHIEFCETLYFVAYSTI